MQRTYVVRILLLAKSPSWSERKPIRWLKAAAGNRFHPIPARAALCSWSCLVCLGWGKDKGRDEKQIIAFVGRHPTNGVSKIWALFCTENRRVMRLLLKAWTVELLPAHQCPWMPVFVHVRQWIIESLTKLTQGQCSSIWPETINALTIAV